MPPLQLGALVHHGDLAALLGKLQKQVLTDVGVGHLPAAEAHGDLDRLPSARNFCALRSLTLKSLTSMLGDIRISLILYHALILAGFLLALGLLEPELAVIHQLAYGGTALGEILTRSSPCSSAMRSAS